MKRIIALAMGAALLASPAAAGGLFEDAAIAYATARAACPSFTMTDEDFGVVLALAASEMGKDVYDAVIPIAEKSIVAEFKMRDSGSLEKFCDHMQKARTNKGT